MKKLIVLLMVAALSAQVSAKSLRDLWISMPDSLMPVLDKNLRLEFVDLKDTGVKAEVRNLLGEDCSMDTLTATYMHLTVCKHSTCEMLLLPRLGSDSLLCVVRTFSGPEKESEVHFYDQQWREVSLQELIPADVYAVDCYFKAKPDTMSEEKYHDLHMALESGMWCVKLSSGEESLTFQLSLPLLCKEEKAQLSSLLVQRKFKWNGQRFNES